MKEYNEHKAELLAIARNHTQTNTNVSDVVLPEIKDSNGNIIFPKKMLSSIKFIKPLRINNTIVSGELNLLSLEKADTKTFIIKVSNQGSTPCYNAKWVLFKQEGTELKRKDSSEKFTIGVDETKIIEVKTKEDIIGTYYAVVHDPIMDSFPFAAINEFIKNQLPDPSSANSGWSTHSPIGNSSISNQPWIFQMIPLLSNLVNNLTININSVSPPDVNQSSELKYKLVIPDFLKSSIKKNKVSVRFGSSCLLTGILGFVLFEGKIKLNINNNTSENSLKAIDNISAPINKRNGFENIFINKLNPNTHEIDFFIQAIKKSTATSNRNPNILLKKKNLLFSQVNLYFEHRQMCQFPKIKTT